VKLLQQPVQVFEVHVQVPETHSRASGQADPEPQRQVPCVDQLSAWSGSQTLTRHSES